jgi:hypothetical protein
MQLSPLNMIGARARLLYGWGDAGSSGDAKSNVKRRVEEVVMYRCPVCRDLHDWESDAEKCCQETPEEKASGTSCPVCGMGYETHRDAADCCLWKDLDAHTRWRIADAVHAGSEWVTELGLNAELSSTSAAGREGPARTTSQE